ncbi:hypothetical protein FO519_008172 [Halicephalobus sp. NKZ332]|nr:hypothetical protein FO519_008172 [Halicephalobus sp. NKZ332]
MSGLSFIQEEFIVKNENGVSEISPRRRTTTAIYPDSLRFLIIEEVEKRPILWDTKSREPMSLVQRKQALAEIAEVLSTSDTPLKPKDIEKQWKNLKDTYIKVKKRNEKEDAGTPKWRFFSSLIFIDQIDEEDSNASSPSPREVDLKRKVPGESEESSKKNRNPEDVTQSSAVNVPNPSPAKPFMNPNMTSNAEEDDDYTYYCRYLNRQLKEIGSISKTEFLKVQKKINDIIFETQIKLSSRD